MSHPLPITDDPEALELAYRRAAHTGDEDAFAEAIEARYAAAPDNPLLAAWHYRLAQTAATVKERLIAWNWALPCALLNGLLLWLLSDTDRFALRLKDPFTHTPITLIPLIALLAAPVSAAMIIAFLAGAGKKPLARLWPALLGLALAVGYVLALYRWIWPRSFQSQYLSLMLLHLGLLSWAAVGFVALKRRREARNRFAFLIKSLEVLVVAGLLAVAGGVVLGVTTALFSALDIELSELVIRLFVAGGGGLIAPLAVALVYDPTLDADEQSFDEGISKLIPLLLRLLLPVTAIILYVYALFIPFRWREPLDNRDVLITFNAMLFAVAALLVSITPVHEDSISPRLQTWLRRGILALAALAAVIGVYALAAILYRASIDRLTPNRLAFTGWNVVNIALLALLLVQQVRAGRGRWLAALQRTISTGVTLYLVWALICLLALPILFHGNAQDVAALPSGMQDLVYNDEPPTLLKCPTSPHIYLLENGQKRWIKDIPTLVGQGYQWSDVLEVSCKDLRQTPDGPPIPPDAGPPPQP